MIYTTINEKTVLGNQIKGLVNKAVVARQTTNIFLSILKYFYPLARNLLNPNLCLGLLNYDDNELIPMVEYL